MKRVRILGLVLATTITCVVVGVAGTSGDARATTDAKRYPASACVAVANATTDGTLDGQYGYSAEGFLENYSTTTVLKIQCAAARECTNTASSGHWFAVRDDNTTAEARCRVEVRTPTGGYYDGGYAYSSSASTTPARYSVSGPTDSPSYNYVSMYCELPAQESGRWRNIMVAYELNDDGC